MLKFVDEALGDPFLQFDVLVSEGRQPKGNSRSETPEFRRVARTLVPNKQQRLFEIELEYAEEFAGMGLRFVQVLVTGSDFAQGREISRDEYEALLEADRGRFSTTNYCRTAMRPRSKRRFMTGSKHRGKVRCAISCAKGRA